MILPELGLATPAVQRAHAVILTQVEEIEAGLSDRPTFIASDMRDALVAYLMLARSLERTSGVATSHEAQLGRRRSNARLVVAREFTLQSNSMASVNVFVDLACTYPQEAATLVDVVTLIGSKLTWPARSVNDVVLGRLSRDVYDDAQFNQLLPRTDYLTRRCSAQRLNPTQFELAHTLAPDWSGTLSALVETARTLRPLAPTTSVN